MQVLSSRRELGFTLAVLAIIAIGLGVLAARMVPVASSDGSGKALIGGPFELVDQHGETVTEATFAGRYMLVYFGYSFCPDICPTSLQTMAAAYDLLSPEERAKVQPIFITVDPERDTVEAMADYVPLFSADLIGLTGTQEQTDAAAKAYRVYHAKAEVDGAADYLVDHSSFFYLMAPDGSYATHFGHEATEEEMAEGIREIIGQ